jgi:hypothetical protein
MSAQDEGCSEGERYFFPTHPTNEPTPAGTTVGAGMEA